MAESDRYASLNDLQDMLTDRTSATAPLMRLLDSASTAVEDRCGRVFTCADSATERIFPARLSDLVVIDDISSAAGVTVSTGSADSWATLDAGAWWLTPANAAAVGRPFTELRSSGRFTVTGRPSVKVSAVWGWPEVPGPVTEAVLLLAARLYSRRSSPSGVAGFGDYGVVRVSITDADVESMLSPYMLPGFA